MILPLLHDSFLGFAAIFFCIGFGMLFLRRAAVGIVGPGYWSMSFFLNCAGFLFWAATVTSNFLLFFYIGEALHMLGFIALVSGAYRFLGKNFQHWNISALSGFAFAWVVVLALMPQHRSGSFFLLMVLRTILFLWAGIMILRHVPTKSMPGRSLAGGGLLAWGIYVLLFPFFWRFQSLLPVSFGFLVGFHLLAAVGMVVLVIDRLRVRAEASEVHVERLEGLLPICSHCKKIRDDHDRWHNIETYVRERSGAEFSHGICPACAKKYYPGIDIYDESN